MDDNMGDDLVTNLDLNQEPFVDPSPPSPAAAIRFGSFSDELETSQIGIEDRIRQLEAISVRARQPQRWRRVMNNPAVSFVSVIDPIVGITNQSQGNNRVNAGGDVDERVAGERARNSKRDITHLAKALEMELDTKKTDNGGDGNNGSFFDCNICLDMAKDPVLTCCGHLFCWACFYQVPYVDSISRECPVCKGEVIDSNITPIYGNGSNSQSSEFDCGFKIPSRPPAHRVEGVRQQSFGRGIAHIPVVDAIRRIRFGLGLIHENPPPPPPPDDRNSVASTSEINRSISVSPASFSSISSAINSAERFVEDLETYINDTGELITSLPISSGSNPSAANATTVLHLGTLATDGSGSVGIDLTIARPASSRRRIGVSRSLNLEAEPSLELRRRRLR